MNNLTAVIRALSGIASGMCLVVGLLTQSTVLLIVGLFNLVNYYGLHNTD